MNSKGIVPVDEDTCMKCLKKKATHIYYLRGRGYGSGFDGWDTVFQCCDDCDDPQYEVWFNEKWKRAEPESPEDNGMCEDYQYEEKIGELISDLPLQGKELLINRLGVCGPFRAGMETQDWLDLQLGELEWDFDDPDLKQDHS